MKYVVVLPSIYKPWTEACLETVDVPSVMVVNNTVINHGVAASWNFGADAVKEAEADWLIILSAAMRFGDAGMQDFLHALSDESDFFAAQGPGLAYAPDKCDFHCAAISRHALETVGRFDQNFWPAYWEDVDYNYRASLALPDYHVLHFDIDGYCAGVNHGVELGGALRDTTMRAAYMIWKWGDVSTPVYEHPFNNPELPLAYWPMSYDGGQWDE